MPTTFTADPEAAPLAPDPGLGPEALPELSMPIDGEAANAASIAQALKTLANHLARAFKPRANTTVSQRFLQRWRTSLGHTRFGLDRNGLPALTSLHWEEAWDFDAQVTTSNLNGTRLLTGSEVATMRWRAFTSPGLSGSPGIFVTPTKRDRDGSHGDVPRHGRLGLKCGNGGSTFVAVGSFPVARLDATADVCLEWIGTSEHDALVSTSPEVQQGILEIFQDFDYQETDPRSARGLTFVREITAANWQAVAKGASGETKIDTGIAVSAGANMRFRIEFRGASVNDGGNATAYFFIGQILVATITTNLPTTIPAIAYFGVKNTGGASISRSGSFDATVTPVGFSSNAMPSVTT